MKRQIILIILMLSNSVHSFTLNPNTGKGFNSNSINIRIANTSCTGAGFSTSQFSSMVSSAVKTFWNAVPTSALKLKVSGIDSSIDIDGMNHTTGLNSTPNNQILAGCNDDATDFTNPSILGSAVMKCTGSTCKAILILNANNSKLNDMSSSEVEAVIAHEIGHAIGLGHTELKHNLMYYNIGGKNQKWLGQDDINGITYLYPHDPELAGLLGSCGTIALNTNEHKNGSRFFLSLILGLILGFIFKYNPFIKTFP
jgi:hypothetical protein